MKKVMLKLVGVIIIAILIQTNVVIGASSQKDLKNVDNKIEEKKEELNNIKEEKTDTMSQVEELTNKISSYQQQIEELDSKINDLNTQISDSQEQLNKAQEDYTKQEELLNARLVATYEAGDTSYLDFILSSESITDLISNYYLISEIATNDSELLEKIQKQKDTIENTKKTLENSKNELATSKTTKQSVSSQLQSTKEQKNEQVAKLSEDEKSVQAQIDELVSHEASIKAEIAKMKAEFDKKGQQPNNVSNNGNSSGSYNNSGTSSYGFGWPVVNHTIGTRYGVSGSWWSSGHHTGVDFPVGKGTAVYAVGNGQVFDTGYNSAYGNFVEIYHGNNVYSFYAHASSVNVTKGQTVSKGQQIMLSGSTGNVSGPHLHFEIRSPGYGYYSCVNPMNYLP